MKAQTISLFLLLSFLAKIALAQAPATKDYSITPEHITSTDGPPKPRLNFTVLNEKGEPYIAYALVINGMIIQNSTSPKPLSVPIMGGQTYKIDCYAMTYKTVKIPPLFVKSDETMNITIRLTDNDQPIKD